MHTWHPDLLFILWKFFCLYWEIFFLLISCSKYVCIQKKKTKKKKKKEKVFPSNHGYNTFCLQFSHSHCSFHFHHQLSTFNLMMLVTQQEHLLPFFKIYIFKVFSIKPKIGLPYDAKVSNNLTGVCEQEVFKATENFRSCTVLLSSLMKRGLFWFTIT